MAALRSKRGNDCSLHIDEGARFQADYTIIADRDTGVHADSRFATFISRILRSAAHRLRGSLCFAALWYANSFIHGKQTCAAPTKLLGASGDLQNERRRIRGCSSAGTIPKRSFAVHWTTSFGVIRPSFCPSVCRTCLTKADDQAWRSSLVAVRQLPCPST
jgi:hypothetical protein